MDELTAKLTQGGYGARPHRGPHTESIVPSSCPAERRWSREPKTVPARSGSAALAVPFLNSLGRSARAQEARSPRRLVIFYTNNGCLTNRWFPTGIERSLINRDGEVFSSAARRSTSRPSCRPRAGNGRAPADGAAPKKPLAAKAPARPWPQFRGPQGGGVGDGQGAPGRLGPGQGRRRALQDRDPRPRARRAPSSGATAST